jgi:GNAT superfamily N-acetyltransferase
MSRVEDAGLNASAPPQQRWLDGWLVRYLPGKARRARCINALAIGILDLDKKLALANQIYSDASLPMIFRLHRFTQPANLDAQLAMRGFRKVDETQVMVCAQMPHLKPVRLLPAGISMQHLHSAAFAEAVGALRNSPIEHRESHALRLLHSPVQGRGYVLRRDADGQLLAAGQYVREGELVGLYDVITCPNARGEGHASRLCAQLMAMAAQDGAQLAYLQVDSLNHPARHVYQSLGFADAYRYHYREPSDA